MTGAVTNIEFDLKSGDLAVRATFAEPVFGLFQDFPSLGEKLHKSLAGHGIGLADFKFEGTSGSLADVHLALSLVGLSAILRVRLDQVELYCFDVRNLQDTALAEIFARTIKALRVNSPAPSLASFTLAIGLHGTLNGKTTNTFLEQFISTKSVTLGPSTGVGGVMYFGPSGNRTWSAVTLDQSASVNGGLFLRANAIWPASAVELDSLQAVGREFFTQVTSQLGLQIR